MSSSGPPPSGQPGPATPTAVRYAARGPKNPTSRVAEAARERTLRRDKDNFSTLRDRSKGHIVNGPYKLRPPVKISTKTIDTDTIGRVNKANQKMSQFLYSLANEPSVGLYHVNEHIRRTVPRLVGIRKDMDFQRVELDKSSCDIEEILPIVRTIGSLASFKSMQSLLQKSILLATPKPASSTYSSSSRGLVAPSPKKSTAPSSPNASMKQMDVSGLLGPGMAPLTPIPQAPNQLVSLEPASDPSDELSSPIISELSTPIPFPSEAIVAASQDLQTTTGTIENTITPEEQTQTPHTSDSHQLPQTGLPPTQPADDDVKAEETEEVDLSPSETPLTQEEMILGNRNPASLKKKKRNTQSENISLVPKAF